MAGIFAHKIKAKKMILTHFSSRYGASGEKNEESGLTIDDLVKEAQVECPNAQVLAAEDLKKFDL